MSKPKPKQKIMLDVPEGIRGSLLREHVQCGLQAEAAGYATFDCDRHDALLASRDSARLATLDDALVEKVACVLCKELEPTPFCKFAPGVSPCLTDCKYRAAAAAALRVAFGEEGQR